MRERDLKALEFDKVIALVTAMAVSEPGRDVVARSRPSTDPGRVRERLRATAELLDLRAHSGSVPIDDFADQRALLLAAAPEGAVLNGESLVRIRDFVVAARTAAAFLRSRVESRPHLAAIVQNLVAPKELADALLGALADDGGLLDEASPELKRLRTRLRDERLELETRNGLVETSCSRVSGGIVLKRRSMDMEAWVAALGEALATEARRSDTTRQALERLLTG